MEILRCTKSYYHNAAQVPKLEGLPIGQLFDRRADQHPDREAFLFPDDGVRITYGELKTKSENLANGLIALGFQHGDCLGVWTDNHVEWVLIQFAAVKIGLVLVSLHTGFTEQLMEDVLQKTKCSGLVMGLAMRDLFSTIKGLIPELAESKPGKLRSPKFPLLHTIINLDRDERNGMYQFSEVMETGEKLEKGKLEERMKAVDFDDVSHIFFTSGSTGFPKAVTHTHNNRLRSWVNNTMTRASSGRIFTMSPFSHISGGDGPLMGTTVNGCTYIVGTLKWQAGDIIKVLQEYQVNGLFLLPHLLQGVIDAAKMLESKFPAVEWMATGGSMLSNKMLRTAAEVLEAKVFRAYGSTEAISCLMHDHDSPLDVTTSTDGYPCLGCEVKVVNERGHVVPVGVCGEICIRSPYGFLYYLGDDDTTREVKKPDGWFHSGDLAVMDDRGYCRIVGRKTDTILRAGLNIYPAEIENVLIQHPDVSNSSVVPIPCERVNEEICVCVILKDECPTKTEDLKEFCRGRVHQDYQPDHFLFFKEFPKTYTQKIDKKSLVTEAQRIIANQ